MDEKQIQRPQINRLGVRHTRQLPWKRNASAILRHAANLWAAGKRQVRELLPHPVKMRFCRRRGVFSRHIDANKNLYVHFATRISAGDCKARQRKNSSRPFVFRRLPFRDSFSPCAIRTNLRNSIH